MANELYAQANRIEREMIMNWAACVSMPRDATLREKLNKATLERLYNTVRLSSVDIAQRYAASPSQIRGLMAEYDIRRRPRGTRTY